LAGATLEPRGARRYVLMHGGAAALFSAAAAFGDKFLRLRRRIWFCKCFLAAAGTNGGGRRRKSKTRQKMKNFSILFKEQLGV